MRPPVRPVLLVLVLLVPALPVPVHPPLALLPACPFHSPASCKP